ncbi:MAG: DUF4421 family protein [Bacteroidia bacterium]
MIKKLLLPFLFMLISLSNFAGEVDSNYVGKFKNIFAAKAFLLNNGFLYTLTPRNNSSFSSTQLKNAEVFYSPHIPPATGVSLNIEGIGFTYIFKFTNDYLDTTGLVKSGFKQFQMNIYKNKFGFEAFYQDYQRFYFHYKGDQILSKNYNNDIRDFQFGGNAVFIFNGKKFSYNAAFNQTQFQKKSAGSGLMMLSLKFNEIKSGNFIPDSVQMFYNGYGDLKRNRNYGFLLQGGYAFNLTKNHFYYSTALLAGAGIQFQSYTFPLDRFYKIGFPLIGRVKASAGYNGKIFFAGLFGNADATQSYIHAVKTQQLVYSYGIYIGFRAIEMSKYKKSHSQLHKEAKEKKLAEKEAKEKEREAAKKAKAKKK